MQPFAARFGGLPRYTPRSAAARAGGFEALDVFIYVVCFGFRIPGVKKVLGGSRVYGIGRLQLDALVLGAPQKQFGPPRFRGEVELQKSMKTVLRTKASTL